MILRIKEELKKKDKMTTALLAEKVGITRANMSNIVNGKTTPSLSTLQKIASALEVPVSELFDQPQNDVINCPHCGGKIKISKHGLHG
jgi:transcriptional regulator with XRE-family HTH domain